MKATLLERVRTIEDEAEDIVVTARADGEKAVEDIRVREQEAIDRIQDEAQERGKKIVKERVGSMKDEVAKIKQESSQAAQKMKEAAEKNRADVLAKAQQLFKEEYLT